MDCRERVLTALSCGQPDRVPFMYSFIDPKLQEQIVGHELTEYLFDLDQDPGIMLQPGQTCRLSLNYCIHPETARRLELDAIGIRFPVPLFCEARRGRGGYMVARGLLTSAEALKKVRMPDVDDPEIYREVEAFVERFGGEFCLFGQIRLGAAPTLLSMGYDGFSYALYDEPDLACEVVDLYAGWVTRLIENLRGIGLDFLWSFDDIAFNNGPLFSLAVWKEVFLPRLKRPAERIDGPWIYHSDGNLLPILDEMLPLGMSAIHPLEPGTLDLDRLKRDYGKRLCLVGNIDVNYTLSRAPAGEVEPEVRRRIEQLAGGGGFIISDSNSVPYFCKAENILAMSRAVQKHRNCY